MTDPMMKKTMAAVEAVLFTMGTSVPAKVLTEALQISEEELFSTVEMLSRKYEAEDSGIRVIRLEDAYQLCTKKDYYDVLIKVATTPFRPVMTEVLLEVLSIVAYKQPVTRGEIERIRGVSSDYAVNRLIEYGLIEEAGRQDSPGRPILFKTTEDFLRKFGLSSVEELPAISDELLEEAAHEALKNTDFVMEGQFELPIFSENGKKEEEAQEEAQEDVREEAPEVREEETL